MGESEKSREMRTVDRAEFLRDPAAVLRRAEVEGPITICDAHGKTAGVISAPRTEPGRR